MAGQALSRTSELHPSIHGAIHGAIHGPNAACHELHGGPAGGFGTTVEALSRARGQGRPAWVASWLTRSNCRSLVGVVDLLVGYGVAGWVIAWPRAHDCEAASRARTIPRLGIAVPHALRAVQRATQRGLPTVLVGVPACTLGPFAAQGRPGREAGVYPASCEGCPSREGCGGIDPWYLERFGSQELRAVPVVPRASLPEESERELLAAASELEGIG